MQHVSDTMTATERRASIGLAGIYGLRMLGLFIILPVFALYAAERLPGGDNKMLVGLALGAYGLTQAILQIPAGWLSDRYGRKVVIYAGLLLFAIGSFIAASADNIYWVIAGRVIQGAGAINAAVMALTADLTREEHRTKAMAMIGITIGITFSISLVLSPVLYHAIDVPGIFALTGVLALLAMPVVAYVIPDPAITRFHSDTEPGWGHFAEVLHNKDLLRLDFGIFSLHAILMSVFMQVPFVLKDNGLAIEQHWVVYLPVMLIALMLMVPPIIITAMGVYSSVQFLGAFFGAIMGGFLMHYVGGNAVFIFAICLLLLWLLVASTMQPPAAVRTRMYHLEEMTGAQGVLLQQQLAKLQGVREVMVVAAENIACLKVEMSGFDEAAVENLVKGE